MTVATIEYPPVTAQALDDLEDEIEGVLSDPGPLGDVRAEASPQRRPTHRGRPLRACRR
jgi:hypothetical protein